MLAEYEPFTIKFRSGKLNKPADSLSRIYANSELLPEQAFCCAIIGLNHNIAPSIELPERVYNMRKRTLEVALRKCIPSHPELYRAQREDEFCLKRIVDITKYPIFVIKNKLIGIMSNNRFKPVLPNSLTESVITAFHETPLHAHMGIKRTAYKIAEIFSVPQLRKKTKNLLSGCLNCLARKQPLQKTGVLASKPSVRMWEQVAMDFAGAYPESTGGKRYILVIIDHFSKYVEIVPCEDMNASTVVNAFYERIICRHGCPERVLSDNHKHFKNKAVDAICRIFGCYKSYISIYYPQGDGQVERFMRNMNDSLSALCDNEIDDWCSYVPGVQFAYNTTVHSVTGVTPFMLNHGRQPRYPHEVDYSPETNTGTSPMRYMKRLKYIIDNVREQATQKVKNSWLLMAKAYNKRRTRVKIAIGEYVLVRTTPTMANDYDAGRKLPLRWSDPMKVVKTRSSGKAFEVQDKNSKNYVFNATRILPIPPSNWKPEKTLLRDTFDSLDIEYETDSGIIGEETEYIINYGNYGKLILPESSNRIATRQSTTRIIPDSRMAIPTICDGVVQTTHEPSARRYRRALDSNVQEAVVTESIPNSTELRNRFDNTSSTESVQIILTDRSSESPEPMMMDPEVSNTITPSELAIQQSLEEMSIRDKIHINEATCELKGREEDNELPNSITPSKKVSEYTSIEREREALIRENLISRPKCLPTRRMTRKFAKHIRESDQLCGKDISEVLRKGI